MKDYDLKDKRLTRLRGGLMDSDESYGWNGSFRWQFGPKKIALVIASDEGGWEHVSVHLHKRNARGKVSTHTPTWADMCEIKDLFWKPEEVVLQYHPAKENYVNNHPNVLHLWRPTETTIPTPPKEFV